MEAAYKILGWNAFRKKYAVHGRGYPINKALFEAWAVNLDSLSDDDLVKIESRKSQVLEGLVRLMNEREFEAAISASTGDISKVEKRFKAIKDLLHEALK